MSATTASAESLSQVFRALADPTRRDMVAMLADGDATVTELAEPHDVTVQAISKHLKVLEDAGVVSRSQHAQTRPAHLEAEVFELLTVWLERHRRRLEERYQRLDDLLASMPDGPPATADTDVRAEHPSRPTHTDDHADTHPDDHTDPGATP